MPSWVVDHDIWEKAKKKAEEEGGLGMRHVLEVYGVPFE